MSYEDMDYNELNTISMIGDNGEPIDFIIMDTLLVEDTNYLLVVEREKYILEEPEAYILREISRNDEELSFEEIHEDEYNKIAKLFQNDDYEIDY